MKAVWLRVMPDIAQLSVLPLLMAAAVVEALPFASSRTVTGWQTAVGAWRSLTVTVKAQVVELPAASVTRKVFVVTPIGKVAPEAKPAICIVVAPLQLSVPLGVV